MGFIVRRSENSTVEIIFPQGCDFRQDTKKRKTEIPISIAFPIENLHVLALKKNINQQIAVAILPQCTPKIYTWPGSNWRPSACWADVIATRPQVQVNTTIVIQTLLKFCQRRSMGPTVKNTYTWPGSNWRPSACEADVIATRPQVL